VTTAKDAIRMARFAPAGIAWLEIDLEAVEGSFADLLGPVLDGPSSSAAAR